jgi:hypothetical protein
MEKYMYWYTHGEPYIPHDTMVERMVGSTSSDSNVHGIIDDNSNLYKNMIMDAIGMNYGHADQCSIINEESNADMAKVFDLLKDSDEPLWDGCTNYIKLSVVAQVFTIKLGCGFSEAGYDKIVK